MKHWLRRGLLLVLWLSLCSGPAWAQERVGTVNLSKLFDGYWKKKQAEARVKERFADMEKEVQSMLDNTKKLKMELLALQTSLNDTALSAEEHDQRAKAAEEKLKQVKDQEDLLADYRVQARETIDEQWQRMRRSILLEIRGMIAVQAKAAGCALVLDTSAEVGNPAGEKNPVVFYTNRQTDLTGAVLLQLNETDPAQAAGREGAPVGKRKAANN